MLNLQKGEGLLLDLNKIGIKKIDIGLGWDTNCDLDAYAILRDSEGTEVNTVYFGNKSVKGVRLSGDNLTGAGDGDDEIIYLDLAKIDTRVKIISVYANIFSPGKYFKDVKGSYIRLVNPSNNEILARANLEDRKLDDSKTVHFADITLSDSFDFYVVMEGSINSPESMNYSKNNNQSNQQSCEPQAKTTKTTITSNKRKKWFGIF